MQSNNNWEIITNTDSNAESKIFESRILINAAGAWADDIAQKAGLEAMNICPLRRCLLTFKPHNDEIQHHMNRHINATNDYTMPWIFGVDETGKEFWYLAPQSKSGLFLCSPANTDEDIACDAYATDLEIAICIDRIETYTKCKITKIESKWAGLRCAAPDYNFILGAHPQNSSFYFCAGLYGQGVQAAPAYSQILSHMICNKPFPQNILDIDLDISSIKPDRLLPPISKNDSF